MGPVGYEGLPGVSRVGVFWKSEVPVSHELNLPRIFDHRQVEVQFLDSGYQRCGRRGPDAQTMVSRLNILIEMTKGYYEEEVVAILPFFPASVSE